MKKLICLFSLLALAIAAKAQQFDNPVTIPISYYGKAESVANPSSFSFGSNLGATASGYTTTAFQFYYSSVATGNVVPGLVYTVTITATNTAVSFAYFQPVDGCQIYINGVQTSTATINGGSGTFTLRVETKADPAKSLSGKRGGESSSFPEDKPIWFVGAGTLRTGSYAGALGFRATSITSALFSSSALIFGNVDSSEVTVTRSGGNITQVVARDVVFNVSGPTGAYSGASSGYTITACQSATPSTPFITYQVSPYTVGSVNGIRVDRTEGTDVRSTVLIQNGTTGWTLYDWRTGTPGSAIDTANPITTTISGTTETITYGTGAGQLVRKKTYTTVGSFNELASSTMGPSETTPLTTSYAYYPNSSGAGWYDAVSSVIDPAGDWTAYDYYNTAQDSRQGLTYHVYQPWLNAPASPSFSTSSGKVTTYTYTTNFDGNTTAPWTKTVAINGTTAALTNWSYNWNYQTSVNGTHTIAQTVEQDSSASGSSLTTTTLSYRPDDGTTFFQNKPHSVTHPDGTKEAYAYYYGTWSASGYSFSASATGNDRLILTFHGQSTAGTGGVSVGSWTWTTGTSTTWTLDSLYMVPDLSTVTETVIDTNGHTVFTSQDIFVSTSDIERISGTASAFNADNQLKSATDIIRTVASAGTSGVVAITYTYQGALLATKTDIDGTLATYNLDNYLNITSVVTTSHATSVFPTVTQPFTYYGSNLKNTGYEQLGSALQSTYTYDTAGRTTSVSVPSPAGGNLTTSYAYPSARTTIVTLPTGATKQTDLYLDGKTADAIGSAQVASYFNYSVNGSGQVVQTTQHDSTQTNGWVTDTFDWLGRKVSETTPEWNWTNNANLQLQKIYSYNSSGQLASVEIKDLATSTDVRPVHLYLYGNMGMMTEEGDDVDAGGTLVAASNDRIKLYNTYFYKDTGGYNGWIKCDQVQTYNTFGNGSNLTTLSQVSTRYTQFNNGAMEGTARVLSDTVTLDASGRYTVDWTWSDLTAQTTTKYHVIEGASQPAYTYYQNGHIYQEQSVSNVVRNFAYDTSTGSYGHLLSVTEATTNAKNAVTYVANTDNYNTITETTGPSSRTTNTYSYALNTGTQSNTVGVEDAAGNYSYTEYNALGLVWHQWGTALQPALTTYDAYGRKTGLTMWQSGSFTGSTWPSPSGGNTTSWTLDPSTGATNTKTFADSSHVTFTYNALGNMLVRTWARGVTTTYQYFTSATSGSGANGAIGELQQVSYSDGTTPTVAYTYTRFGKSATVQDAAGTRTLNYRSDLKLGNVSLPSFYDSDTLVESYDSMGRNTGYVYYNGYNQSTGTGTQVAATAFTFDAASARWSGNTVTVGSTTPAFTFGYASGTDWVNAVTSGNYSRSLPLTGSYDVIASATTNWSSSTLASFSTAYTDSRGWRSGQSVSSSPYTTVLAFSGAYATAYSYDGYGEVTGSSNSGSNATALGWTYDLSGNRSSETDSNPGGSTSYTPNAVNQYSAITGTLGESTLSYDTDGNMTQDGTWTYTYDGENRLTKMVGGGSTLTFTYDYKGRRISKTVNGTVTKFLWHGWTLAADLQSDGNTPMRTYVWGPDFSDSIHGKAGGAGSLLAEIDSSGNVIYAVPDTMGNIVAYANSSGSLVGAVEYSAYGKVLGNSGGYSSYPIGYSGQYTDWETGLVYYGKRFYNPKHGRFINRDPIEESGGNNLYAFVGNSPTLGWDVKGMSPQGATSLSQDPSYWQAILAFLRQQYGGTGSGNFMYAPQSNGTIESNPPPSDSPGFLDGPSPAVTAGPWISPDTGETVGGSTTAWVGYDDSDYGGTYSTIGNEDDPNSGGSGEFTPIGLPTGAVQNGKAVTYYFEDDHYEVWSGGSRAWRNNNPGNLRNGSIAKANGSIGQAGGFAVFPDYLSGRNALEVLLGSSLYRNETVGSFLNKYAPSSENDTGAYRNFLERQTGLDGGLRLSSLNNAQLNSVMNAIQKYEGYTPGTVDSYPLPVYQGGPGP